MINRVGDFIECIDHVEKGDGNASSARIIARRFAQGQRGQARTRIARIFRMKERFALGSRKTLYWCVTIG
jgi:hypothetical protein